MKKHPILFSTLMIQAILSGQKTQTRRIIKPHPIVDFDSGYVYFGKHQFDIHNQPLSNDILEYCPYGIKEDVLWVREQFGWYNTIISESYGYIEPEEPRYPPHVEKGHFKRPVIFKADYPKYRFDPNDSGWKPSIHMPYTACRIWLDIVNIRVERLQDISEKDAIEEGISFSESFIDGKFHCLNDNLVPVESYKNLWEYINGKGSWDKNPWVWVIEFKVKEILK